MLPEDPADLSMETGALAARARRVVPFYAWRLAPFAFIALAFLAERIMSSDARRFAIVPGTGRITEWVIPSMQNLDQAIVGYVLLVLAAAAFALSLKPDLLRRFNGREGSTGQAPTLWIERPSLMAVAGLGGAALVWAYVLRRLLDKGEEWYLPLLVVLAVAVPAYVLFRRDRRRGVSFAFKVNLWELALLAALVSAAGLILTFDLAHIPDSMWGDEGAFWESARGMARHERAVDFFAPGVYGFPLASSIYQALFVKLLGYSVWSWRFGSVAAVLSAMIPLYFLVRAMFDRWVAFAAVVLTATSPFALAFGRMGYNNMQALFPLLLTLLLLYLAVERRSSFLFFAAGLAAGLGFYTYFGDRVAVIIIAGFVCYAWLTRRLTLREAAYGLGLAAVGTIMVGLLPVMRTLAEGSEYLDRKMVEGLFANAFYVRAMFGETVPDSWRSIRVADVDIVFDTGGWARLLGRGLLRTLLAFHRTDLVKHHYIAGSLGGPLISALLLPGVALAVRHVRRPGYALVLLWTLVAIIVLGVLSAFPPAQAHLVTMIPAVAIVYAVVLLTLAEVVARFFRVGQAYIVVGLAALAVVLFAGLGVREYFYNANREFTPDMDGVISFLARDLRPGQQVAFVFSDDKYQDWVPWGVRWFDVDSRFVSIPADKLEEPAEAERLRQAAAVVVDAREQTPPLDLVRAVLPEWRLSSRNDDVGAPVAWMLRPPQ